MSDTMKAAFIKQPGPPGNIIIGELPKPTIKENQVLVKVKSVAIDHVDTYVRSGKYKGDLQFPHVLGLDMCGVVESVGKDVKNFKPGDRVWCNNQGIHGRQGTLSEYAAINADLLYKLSKTVDEKDAVAVLHSAITALHGLIWSAKLMPNETIFINGGSGNVGNAIVQLAHQRGAKVIASAGSKEKVDWCLKNGADFAFNYKTQNPDEEIKKAAPEGVNVYWDTSRETNLENAVKVLAHQGRIVLMAGGNTNSKSVLPFGPFYNKDGSIVGFSILNLTTNELKNYADIINKGLEEKILSAKIAKVLPLSETAKAHEMIESDPSLWGKIVITIP